MPRPAQIIGRERRERVSQLARCGAGCFDSRRRVNFYEAGSGQVRFGVDWFTLLFEVSTNNLCWLLFVVSFNGATKLILKREFFAHRSRGLG